MSLRSWDLGFHFSFVFSLVLQWTPAEEGKLRYCHTCGSNSKGSDARMRKKMYLEGLSDLSPYPIALLA